MKESVTGHSNPSSEASSILRTSTELFDRDLNQHAREPTWVHSSTRDLRRHIKESVPGHSSPSSEVCAVASSELATSCSDVEQHYESRRIGQGDQPSGAAEIRVPVGERTTSANTSGQGDQPGGAAETCFSWTPLAREQ